MEPIRDSEGNFAPTVTDDELWAAYVDEPSSKKVARKVGLSVSQVRKRLAKIREKKGLVQAPDIDRAGKLEKMLSSVPVIGPEGARLNTVDVKLWGIGAKDELTQQIITQGLDGITARYRLDEKATVEYPPPQPHYVVEVKTYNPLPPPAQYSFERVFIIGDIQIGFWRHHSGLVPFHDVGAIDLMLQCLARYRPHKVVILGDMLDLPEFSKYRQEPAFYNTTNPAIAYATELLAQIRKIVGDAVPIHFVMGNHEARLTSAIVDKLPAFYRIRRHEAGDKYDVPTVPFLLQFERYDITPTAQFPAGEVWLSDKLVCTHAPDPKLAATTISGHLVKATVDSDTRHGRYESNVYERIIVPGLANYHGKAEDKFRLTQLNVPSNVARSNAQQAIATVDITPDGRRHNIIVWKIENNECFFREHGLLRGSAQPWEYTELAA